MLATVRPHPLGEVGGFGASRKNNTLYAGGSRILMPTVTAMPTNTNLLPRRVPKLAVRDKTSGDQVAESTSCSPTIQPTYTVRPSLSTHSSEHTVPPSLIRRSSDRSEDSLEAPTPHRLGQYGAAKGQANDGKSQKKKGSGMLGFLTLKEPSASAWEEYAETQRKLTAQKSAKSIAVLGKPSQPLPDFVPKTNSKWDGLPETPKKKKAGDRSNRNSTISASTTQTTRSGMSSGSEVSERSAARRYGSLSSKPLRTHAASLSLTNSVSSLPARPSNETATVAYRTPVPTATHPAQRNNDVTPWDEPPRQSTDSRKPTARLPHISNELPNSSPSHTFLDPPSPTMTQAEPFPLLQTPELEMPKTPGNGDYERPRILRNAQLVPQKPPTGHYRGDSIAELAEQYNSFFRCGPNATGEHDTYWHSDTSNEDSVATAVGTLSVKNASDPNRPRGRPSCVDEVSVGPTIREDDEESIMMVSNLRDATGFSSPFVLDPAPAAPRRAPVKCYVPTSAGRKGSASSNMTSMTTETSTTATRPLRSPTFSDMPSESTRPSTAASMRSTATARRKQSPSPTRSNSDASSVAPSIAPSVMSVQWTMTPKQRLGLGGKVTRRPDQDVMPWENDVLPIVSSRSDAASSRRPSEASHAASSRRPSEASHAASSRRPSEASHATSSRRPSEASHSHENTKSKRWSMRIGRK